VARRGATIWIAFNKRGFSPWRLGSIAGGDLPSLADEVLMGDFDGDGFGDLLRRRPNFAIDRSVWSCHRGVGDGTFEAGRQPDLAQLADVSWAIADLGRVGRSDLIVNQNSRRLVTVSYSISPAATSAGSPLLFYGAWFPLLGASSGGFNPSERVLVLDADQNGADDILVRRASGAWEAYLNGGQASFTAAQRVTVGGQTAPFRAGDMLLGSAPQVLH
jgi:hypothetical protein